jgi:hypothetical protein
MWLPRANSDHRGDGRSPAEGAFTRRPTRGRRPKEPGSAAQWGHATTKGAGAVNSPRARSGRDRRGRGSRRSRRRASATTATARSAVATCTASRVLSDSYGPGEGRDLPPALLAVRHIGPRRAHGLIDALGHDWRVCVELAPESVFGTLRGVGPRQANEVADSRADRPAHRRIGRVDQGVGVKALPASFRGERAGTEPDARRLLRSSEAVGKGVTSGRVGSLASCATRCGGCSRPHIPPDRRPCPAQSWSRMPGSLSIAVRRPSGSTARPRASSRAIASAA